MNSVAIHGVLAAAGLALAYQTYSRGPAEEEQPGQVTLLECDPKDVTKIELDTASQVLTVTPKKGGAETEYWLTATRHKKPAEKDEKADAKKTDAASEDGKDTKDAGKPNPADARADGKDPKDGKDAKDKKPGDKPSDPKAALAAKLDAKKADKDAKTAANGKDAKDAKDASDKADASEKPAEPEKPARANDPDAPVTFLGNQKFAETLKQLAPVRALRALGEIAKDKFEAFGFDKIETHYTVECGGRKIVLDVGGRTYGAGDRYARDPQTKQSYLLSGQLLTDLDSARYKFMQSDLIGFQPSEVDQAKVSALGREKKLLQRGRTTPQDARWVDAASPDKRNELFNTWFQRLSRLKVRAFLADAGEPGSDLQVEATGTTPIMTIEYALEGKPKGKIELVRVDTKKEAFYYARSETTKRWVAVYESLAKQVDEDVPMVVGAEEMPPEKKVKKPGASDSGGAVLPHGHPGVH